MINRYIYINTHTNHTPQALANRLAHEPPQRVPPWVRDNSSNTWRGRLSGRSSELFSYGVWDESAQTLCLCAAAPVQPENLVSVCVPLCANVFQHVFEDAGAGLLAAALAESESMIWSRDAPRRQYLTTKESAFRNT